MCWVLVLLLKMLVEWVMATILFGLIGICVLLLYLAGHWFKAKSFISWLNRRPR